MGDVNRGVVRGDWRHGRRFEGVVTVKDGRVIRGNGRCHGKLREGGSEGGGGGGRRGGRGRGRRDELQIRMVLEGRLQTLLVLLLLLWLRVLVDVLQGGFLRIIGDELVALYANGIVVDERSRGDEVFT